MKTYRAKRVFTGTEWLTNYTIAVDNGLIEDIFSTDESLHDDGSDILYDMIAPSFIDLQIYGAGDKLLAVYPEVDSLSRLQRYCGEGGANNFMPTVATNTYETFYKCIDAVRDYWEKGGEGAMGLHIEGPWINPLKRGAHIESLIHVPTIKQVTDLLEYGKGVIKIITLAPEVCNDEIIDLVKSFGVVLSAGHSNATYAEGIHAFEKIPAATHLFNAMSPLSHRAPGLPAAVMNHPTVMASIIPDNIHVNFEIVSLAKKIMGDRLFIITDAVTETSIGPYKHTLQGDRYVSDGILSGSCLNMMTAVRNCVTKVGIELSEALRMASFYPAKLMKMEGELGIIKKGIKANLVFMDDDLNVIQP